MKKFLSFFALMLTCVIGASAQDDAAGPFDNVKITPADRSVVESLKDFYLDFTAYADETTGYNADYIDVPYLINVETAEKVEGILDDRWNGEIEIHLASEVTAPGNYKLVVPSGNIEVSGNANPELGFTYTIAGAADYTIDPAEGTVESLSSFTITFNNYMVELNEDEAFAYLFNEETEEEVEVSYIDVVGGGKKLYIMLSEEITTPGEWQLIVGDATVKNLKENKFLPELTFYYTIEGTQEKEPIEVDCVAGLYDVEEDGKVILTLNNAKITYVWTGEEEQFNWNTYEYETVSAGKVVLEDETGGILLEDYTLAGSVKEGTVLDGELILICESDYLYGATFRLPTFEEDYQAYIDNTMLIMVAPTEEVEPLEVNEETVDDFRFASNWRLAKFDGILKVQDNYYAKDYHVNIPVMDEEYSISDTLDAFDEGSLDGIADGDEVEVVGYLYEYFGRYTFLQPLSITPKVDPTGVTKIEADGNAKVFYNLNGQKVKAGQKGLYIHDGKKVVVK